MKHKISWISKYLKGIQHLKQTCTVKTDRQYLHAKSCHRYVYKKHIPFGQAIRLRRIIFDDIVLDERLKELETWFTNRDYNLKKVGLEIERVKNMNRSDLLSKCKNEIDNRITLVLNYHPALTKVYEILQKAHRYALKSQRLTAVLPSPPRLAFRNAKTFKDHLVRSKLKTTYEKPEVTICGRKNCEICYILHQGDTFESSNSGKQHKINFSFNCNSRNVVYLLTCKICEKQYVGSAVTKFRSRFNQYKSNVNLYGKGQRGFMQEPLIEHFFSNKHNGSYKDIKVQIIDYCDPNNLECREDFWIYHLDSIYPRGFNTRNLVV